MKQLFLPLSMFVLFCGQLASMNVPSLPIGELLYFNIGGYKMDICRSTIEQFGGTYLKTLISGKFAITKDREDRIFIDRSRQEGKIIDSFIRTRSLPENCDEISARNAEGFFDIKQLKEYIKGRWPKMSEEITYYYRSSFDTGHYCEECTKNNKRFSFPPNGQLTKAIVHLTSEHRAEVLHSQFGTTRYDWEVTYRVPVNE